MRAARDDRQICPGRLIGDGAPLFPIAKGAEGNAVAGGEFFLRDAQSAPNNFRLWRALHTFQIGASERARVWIGEPGAFDGGWRHVAKPLKGFPRGSFPAHVWWRSGPI